MSTPEIIRISDSSREILLLGTAHVSRESVEQVIQAIIQEKPQVVCVELDSGRLDSLENSERWKSFNFKEVIRKKQLGTLLANLLLATHQKRMGISTGVRPGEELLAAVQEARKAQIPIVLADRDVRITLRRAWATTPMFRKILLLNTLLVSMFDRTKISEEEMRELRSQDTLSSLLQEFGKSFPQIKTVLIDERDQYLAGRVLECSATKILVVVGAGHLPGMKSILESGIEPPPAQELTTIPAANPLWKVLGWSIPVLIILSWIILGYLRGPQTMAEGALYWFLANGIPCALGAMLAFAHPLAILTAFVSAPFTSLTPLIGAGYVVAFVQGWMTPPSVKDLENMSDDAIHFSRWWSNRMLRVILAFILPGLGSMLGTWVGGMGIISLFKTT